MSLGPMWDSLAWLAAWAGVYLRVIQVVTGVVALLIAAVVLLLDRELLPNAPRARWTEFFGWSYAVFGLQYLVPAIAMWLVTWLLDGSGTQPEWLSWVHAFCSAVNNVLFLACARALLEKRRPFTPTAWIVAALSVAANLAGSGTWSRLPDAAFSAWCLGFLGYALYRNFSPSRRPGLARLNLLGGILYGFVNFFYAFTPFIASVESRFQAGVMSNLADLARVRSIAGPPSVETAFNAMAFGAAFIVKLALFFGVLLLIMRSLSEYSPQGSRLTLDSIQGHRRAFLSHEVVARAIGEGVGADLAEVGFRLPGVKANRVAWWSWLRSPDRKKLQNPSTLGMHDAATSIVGSVFATGREEFFGDRQKDPEMARRYQRLVPGMSAFATLPVLYQGGIIGCLNVEWSEARPIDATTRLRLRQAADNLAPVLDARRQLYALHQLSLRAHETEEKAFARAEEALRELLGHVHDLLSPLATALVINVGFRRYCLVISDHCDLATIDARLNLNDFRKKVRAFLLAELTDVEEVRLRLKVGNIRLGSLIAFVAPGRDPAGQPSLVGDYLHRQAVATVLSDSLLAIARRNLGRVLSRTQAKLATVQPMDYSRWLGAIQEPAVGADLPWVAATVVTANETLRLGVDALAPDLKARIEELEACDGEEASIAVHATSLGTELLRISLPSSRSILWLGIGRTGFYRELADPSPWRDFLAQLAESADAALLRFERQRLLLETSRMELLTVRMETSRLLLHETRNRALEFSLGTLGVRTALDKSDLELASKRIRELAEQAENFSRVAGTGHRFSELGNAPLSEMGRALEDVQALTANRLHMGVSLTTQVAPELRVAVPVELLVLCLRELIENASRAIGGSGTIHIETVDFDSYIECHVTDSGPGVSESIREKLFEFGVTTRGSSGGLGLALARNALLKMGGDLRLTQTEPGSTTFTLRLPKAPREVKP